MGLVDKVKRQFARVAYGVDFVESYKALYRGFEISAFHDGMNMAMTLRPTRRNDEYMLWTKDKTPYRAILNMAKKIDSQDITPENLARKSSSRTFYYEGREIQEPTHDVNPGWDPGCPDDAFIRDHGHPY